MTAAYSSKHSKEITACPLRTIATVWVTRAVHTATVVAPLTLCSSRRCSATMVVAVAAASVVVEVVCTTIIIVL
jgi:energy-converting hydrogenase Eha subunit C